MSLVICQNMKEQCWRTTKKPFWEQCEAIKWLLFTSNLPHEMQQVVLNKLQNKAQRFWRKTKGVKTSRHKATIWNFGRSTVVLNWLFPKTRFQLILPVQSQNVTKNRTDNRMHVEGIQFRILPFYRKCVQHVTVIWTLCLILCCLQLYWKWLKDNFPRNENNYTG